MLARFSMHDLGNLGAGTTPDKSLRFHPALKDRERGCRSCSAGQYIVQTPPPPLPRLDSYCQTDILMPPCPENRTYSLCPQSCPAGSHSAHLSRQVGMRRPAGARGAPKLPAESGRHSLDTRSPAKRWPCRRYSVEDAAIPGFQEGDPPPARAISAGCGCSSPPSGIAPPSCTSPPRCFLSRSRNRGFALPLRCVVWERECECTAVIRDGGECFADGASSVMER